MGLILRLGGVYETRGDSSDAKNTIAMLKRYADLLENTFVLASDAIEKSIDGEIAQTNGAEDL